MRLSRRHLLLQGLFGTGSLGLSALASGLPTSWFVRTAAGQAIPTCRSKTDAQLCVLSLSVDGDPVNCNVPGTFEHPDIVHPADPQMAPTRMVLAKTAVLAAKPWSTLPQSVLNRACFVHHSTRTLLHPQLTSVLRLHAPPSAALFPELIARALADCLGTTQHTPLVLGGRTGAAGVLLQEGGPLPSISPSQLGVLLAADTAADPSPLASLPAVRDQALDALVAALKRSGQKALLGEIDERALSRSRAKALAEQLRADLASLRDDGDQAQVIAAAALLRMNVAPVVALRIGFGGDNHFDVGLRAETQGTLSGVARIALLQQKLAQYGLADRTTFVLLNSFGRTLKRRGLLGREHLAQHHTAVVIGKPFRGGVIGGVAPADGDFAALPIQSSTGRGDPQGDIPRDETLGALLKTLCVGVGVAPGLVEQTYPAPLKLIRPMLAAG